MDSEHIAFIFKRFYTFNQFCLRINYDIVLGEIKIKTLQFHGHIDFFGLSVQSLNGFKVAAKGAVMKMMNGMLKEGINLNESTTSRLSNTSISLIDKAILLQTKFDIERNFYQQMPISV